MNKRVITLVLTLALILGVSTLLIFQAKGYKYDFKNKKIEKTGIIAISSVPQGAAVYVNGKLSAATNTNLSDLVPGTYEIKVSKEGYITWEKSVVVEPELVTPVEIALFPALPDLSPLTFNGAVSPTLSPDGQKVAYSLSNGEKSGIWILDLSDRPLIFSKEPKQIVKDTQSLVFSKSSFSWSPDSKYVLTMLQENSLAGEDNKRTYLLNIDQLNSDKLVDASKTIENTRKTWLEDSQIKNQDRVSRVKNENGRKILNTSSQVLWSPNETKFIYTPANNDKDNLASNSAVLSLDNPTNLQTYLYDTKKDKTYKLPDAKKYLWYPDDKHVVMVEDSSISIIEYTAENKATIYSGSFDKNIVYPWPNGSKLIISTNFNSAIKESNLYTINLR